MSDVESHVGSNHSTDINVALNDKGIHALGVVLDNDEPATLWITMSSAASITNPFILKENADALEAGNTVSCIPIPRCMEHGASCFYRTIE